ncbi:MAG TPA: hypothetical protein VKY38_02970 [Azoarcus sp.]|nr:hypothetical protein [Azoarcus sp.]
MAWMWRTDQSSLLLAALMLLPLQADAQKAGRTSLFCCESAAGVPVCGEPMPRACYGRAYREISPGGLVVRRVEAPLSSTERAELKAAKQARNLEQAEALRHQRYDEALLETYRSLDELDKSEARAVADIEQGLADLRERLYRLEVERAELGENATQNQMRVVEDEIASYERLIEAREGEIKDILKRYAEERRRYAELIAEPDSANRP